MHRFEPVLSGPAWGLGAVASYEHVSVDALSPGHQAQPITA